MVDKVSGGKPKQSAATILVGMVQNAGVEVFRNAENTAFAVLPLGHTRQTYPLRSKKFRAFCRNLFYDQEDARTPGSQAVEEALATLEATALFAGSEQNVHVRVAEHKGCHYLDLANDSWQAVELKSGAWKVTTKPPVHFIRPRAQHALPTPERGGCLSDLRKYARVADDADWQLLVVWLLFTLLARGPFPVLFLVGQQGSGKSMLAKILRELIDPNRAPLRHPPREPRDLAITATNNWFVVLDNLSQLSDWLSDCLCQLATGGGFSTRELYSDGDEAIFSYTRPIILTSIEDAVSRGDLLERALVLTLPCIAEDKRLTEQELQLQFQRDRPFLIGAILDAAAAALQKLPSVQTRTLLRMADFTRFGIAVESTLRWPAGSFLQAYKGNRAVANDIALNDSILLPAIQKLLVRYDCGCWKGSASDLLEELNAIASPDLLASREWPKKPHTLSGKLRRLAPNLAAINLEVVFERDASASRSRLIILRTISQEQQGQPASEASKASRSRTHQDALDASDAPLPARSDDHWTPFDREPSLN